VLIVAALETGCRRGELFALQWQHVNLERRELHLPGDITKTGRPRTIPISKRLLDELEMRKHAPDGTLHKPSAYVFGNELGERLTDLREAWKLTCAAAKVTGLRFHDLRREFGSRLMETPRISPHVVRDWLGHADITTTSRYLATTERTLKDALQQFEQHRAEIAKRCTRCTNALRRHPFRRSPESG
jgi:integrase